MFLLLSVLLMTSSGLEAKTDSSVIALTQLRTIDQTAVDIKVDLTINYGLAGMALTLEYDHSLLELTGAERGSALYDMTFEMTSDYSREPFSFRWTGGSENDYSKGMLLLLHFTLLKEMPNAPSQVTVTYDNRDITKYDNLGKKAYTWVGITPCTLQSGSDLSLEILILAIAQTVLVGAIVVFVFYKKVKIIYVVDGTERFVDRYKRGEKVILRTFEGYVMYADAKFKKRLERMIVLRFSDIYIYCKPEEKGPEINKNSEILEKESKEPEEIPVLISEPEIEMDLKPFPKTADEWLNMEREIVCQLIDDNKDPFAYLLKELSLKGNPENRIAALKKLVKELDKVQENAKKVPENVEPEHIIIDMEKVMEVAYQQPLYERMAVLKESASSFVNAKKKGLPIIVPALPFLFTREDVLDYMEAMKEKANRYPVQPSVAARSKRHLPDGLKCGEWTFGMMYEKEEVIKFIARMDDAIAAKLMKDHTGIKTALFPKGTNWYDVIIDSSYVSKDEVYAILDSSYDFVLNRYYEKEAEKSFKTDVPSAQEDENKLQVTADANVEVVDKDYTTAISEHQAALLKYKETVGSPFAINRAMLIEFVRASSPETAIVEHDKFYMPVSLKSSHRTYAMIYERFGEIRMVVRISDDFARELLVRHPLITKAKFPNARYWYSILVDGSFEKPEQVYQIIQKAKDFVQE
jgi:predicted DNA-binding protein (MmcQ/YjbR family)